MRSRSVGRRFLLALALVLVAVIVPATNAAGRYSGSQGRTWIPNVDLALIHAKLIDGNGGPPLPDAVILLEGNRIVAAGPSEDFEFPSNVETIDLAGRTVLPGFINAHVHSAFRVDNLVGWAYAGVTTVRDEGTTEDRVQELRGLRALLARVPTRARLVSTGSMLAAPGGYGGKVIRSAEEGRQAVLDEAEFGVDGIKVALEDGYNGQKDLPLLSGEELKAIVETAHEAGLPVSAHVTHGDYIDRLLDAGVDDLSHMPCDAIGDATLREMVARRIAVMPTFNFFWNINTPIGTCVSNLARYVSLGGEVALGNDYAGAPGDFELGMPMFEFKYMAQAGMSTMQIIQASTLNAARVIDMDEELGTVEAGKLADLLVLGGDPLLDLDELTHVKLVVHDGVVIRDEIQACYYDSAVPASRACGVEHALQEQVDGQ